MSVAANTSVFIVKINIQDIQLCASVCVVDASLASGLQYTILGVSSFTTIRCVLQCKYSNMMFVTVQKIEHDVCYRAN
jgi:hypothetical protein